MRSQRRDAPTKVAVIGGGCAALAAAFELTRPELEGRYGVTVYQLGWRLGGKGASGRGIQGRIEEHGLHLWMGYYENAFRLVRACYAELEERRPVHAPDNPLPPAEVRWRFEDAFRPANFNGVMDWSPAGRWLPWKVDFPPMPGLPGDPNSPTFSVSEYLVHAARLLGTLLSALSAGKKESIFMPGSSSVFSFSGNPPTEDEVVPALARFVEYGAAAGLGAAVEVTRWLEAILGVLPQYSQSFVSRLIDAVGQLARVGLSRLTEASDEMRRVWEVAELVLAAMRGSIRFRLAFDSRGFDAIDDYDCREWLKMNGASDDAINSAFIRALYDLAFAYRDGDPERPAIAAGSALRGAFRAFFTYRGAFFWKMNAGMGDAVVAPIYEVLRRRGVRFEFFHKLTALNLSAPGEESPHVATLDFDVQARTVSGSEYRPLCVVKGLPCWPSEPHFDQLVGAEALRANGVDLESQWEQAFDHKKTLRVGADFDFVVLGVGLGVVPSVCGSILERDARWRDMVDRVKSVPTQAFQLWLDRDMAELGWMDRAINLSGFVEPFDTWADMTHVIPVEGWQRAPKSIAYFCNVLADVGEPKGTGADSRAFLSAEKERVRSHCVDFISTHLHVLWPAAYSSNGDFDWSALCAGDAAECDRDAGHTPDRFSTQYWRANVRPSDRYTQALPGSTKYRISPLDRTYDNLTVAGDWTSCSLNMGCVEAAVLSGMLASNALSGYPLLEDIVGYDHP
jgi:uncharacterized protein with NAD-binding domain and iron-sulfur cluster